MERCKGVTEVELERSCRSGRELRKFGAPDKYVWGRAVKEKMVALCEKGLAGE